MRITSGRRAASILCLILLTACLACVVFLAASCGDSSSVINSGETYLNGSWYHDEEGLKVGYNFFPNGTGFLFIGETVRPIRYGVYMSNIYTDINGELSVLPFGTDGEDLLIGNIRFLPVLSPEDGFSADESMLSAQETEESRPVFIWIALAVCGLLIVFILIRFFKTRSGSNGNRT